MNINVLLSSGDWDEWENVHDTIENDAGTMLVVSEIDGDEISGDWKVVTVSQEIDQGPDLPPLEKGQTLRVHAMYAPGMWMKAEYL